MGTNTSHCRYCGRFFTPDPRIGRFQKRCSAVVCRREAERERYRRWMSLNGSRTDRRAKVRAWAKGRSYWQKYREKHAEYVKKDNARRRQAYRAGVLSAKQTSRAVVARGKLGVLEGEIRSIFSAKPTPIAPVITGIVEYLIWETSSAKPTPIGRAAGVDS